MKKRKLLFWKILLFAFFSMNCMNIFSQASVSLPFFDGFEEHALGDSWIPVNGNYANKWYIGEAVASAGKKSLYISGDGGETATYVDSSSGVGVFKEFDLPAGYSYEISFDWMLEGEPSSGNNLRDSLFVCFVQDPNFTFSATPGDIPIPLIPYKRSINQDDDLISGEVWHRSFHTIPGNVNPTKVIFFWVNNSTKSFPPSACIDNFQINKVGDGCIRPLNLTATFEGGARLEWSGNAPEYELIYKNELTGQWVEVKDVITDSPYTVTNLDKGFYTFWLRSICGNDTSAWATTSNMLIAVSMDKCINFVDLYNEKVVLGGYGKYGESAKSMQGIVNDGYRSIYSRHTVHFQPNETDPKVGLKTVPPGELASVRIGNWGRASEAQSLTYSITVDEANPILILKYAVVLENVGHNGRDFKQPRFLLRVTDEGDIPLDNTCTTVSFLAGDLPGWNRNHLGFGSNGQEFFIVWKDWTTIGINLKDYIGRRVKVYIETGDCVAIESCYGYGYFALDCAPNKLEGLTCGSADPTQTMDTIYAPQGFKYEWYKATDPNKILYTTRYFVPQAGDTATYKCRLTFNERGREGCSFELVAALLPRDPAADFSYIACRKTVEFFDESQVVTQNGVTGEKCDVYWHFGDRDSISYERNPVYEFSTPGTHLVTLTASITGGDQVCTHDTVFEVTVSEDTIKTILNDTICYKKYYSFANQALTKAGVYTDTLLTNYGCDSIVILNLEIHDTFAYDTICGGQTYIFEGEELLLEEGLHDLVYKNVKSSVGCDSVMKLFIASTVSFDSEPGVCADEEYLLVNVTAGVDSVQIRFSNESAARGYVNSTVLVSNNSFRFNLPEKAYAGVCTGTFIFYSSYCGVSELDFAFDIKYPSEIIAQRWNDVLAIKSKNFNGGYNFIGYQWYRNGEKMDGETKSYLFVPEGLNPEDRYHAELIREDNVVMSTCEYIPEDLDADLTLVDNKTQINQSYTIKTSEEGIIRLYSITGNLISEHKLSAGTNQLKAPSAAGYYLLQVKTEEQEKTFYLQVAQ